MFPYLKFLSKYWQGERGKIALIFVFVILSQSLSLIEPFFFATIISKYLAQAQTFPSSAVFFHSLMLIVVAWVAVAFGARTFKNLQTYFVNTVADRIGIRVLEHAYHHVLELPMSFHSREKGGELFRKLSKARDDVTALFQVMFDKIFQNSFSIVVVFIIVFWKAWRIGVALFGFIPLFFFVTWLFTRKIKKTQVEINKINEQMFGSSFEAITHVELVKSFSSEGREEENLRHDNQLQHLRLKKKTLAYQGLGFAQGTVVNLARVVLLWWGAVLAYRNLLSFANVILFNFYSFAVYQPLYDLGDIYTKYTEGIAAVDRLQSVLDEPVTIKDIPNAIKINKLQGSVEFKNVSFDYGEGQMDTDKIADEHGMKVSRQILNNISFLVEPGKKLALVGQTGSGKSTVIKLLLRFYEPTSGEILIDGRPIKDYDTHSLHKRIGLVLQDNVLFNTTIADNIRYGTFDAPDDLVKDAAERASLQPFLAKLSNGLFTKVGERGLMVSGGEKQRIAIGRSIIKRPDILIFDEATSALDSHTEEEIRKSILEVSKGVTSITVAHRFATVIDSDEIVLLVNGEIKERGTHKQLLEKAGQYSRIYNLQTQRLRAGQELGEEE
ncbi:MAG: ABC transporter ATP-binding protein [Candidatus Doudnabacteria bacterium]|nr:ABC transporter ATP-binding protein [Candidatus Doudnabacteria bacterium]